MLPTKLKCTLISNKHWTRSNKTILRIKNLRTIWLHLFVELHDALLAGVGGARQEAGDGHAALRTGLHSRLCSGNNFKIITRESSVRVLIGLSHEIITLGTWDMYNSRSCQLTFFITLDSFGTDSHRRAIIVQRNYWRCFENSVRRPHFKSILFLWDHLFET